MIAALHQEHAPSHDTPLHDHPPLERPPGRYAPGEAGTEGEGDSLRFVPIVWHPVFKKRERMRKVDRKELLIKQAALRVAAGLEPRTLREIAKAIGCTHTAIDNVLVRICERIGIRKFMISDAARASLAAGRRRSLEAKREATRETKK